MDIYIVMYWRDGQYKNQSKSDKLPQFSLDFTGDFNRKIGAILITEKFQDFWGYHVCFSPLKKKFTLPTEGLTLILMLLFPVSLGYASLSYLSLFIYLFFISLSHTVKSSGLSFSLVVHDCILSICTELLPLSFHHSMAGQSVSPAGVN